MACTKGIELPDECWDISSGAYEINGTSPDTDFSEDANAEVLWRDITQQILTVGSGIEISEEDGVPDRRIKVTISTVHSKAVGDYIFIRLRPTADTKDLISQRVKVVDFKAER